MLYILCVAEIDDGSNNEEQEDEEEFEEEDDEEGMKAFAMWLS